MIDKLTRALLAIALLAAGLGSSEPGDSQTTTDAAACQAGDARACTAEGYRLESPTTASAADVRQGLALYRRSCDLGNDYGCRNVANMEIVGRGGARDVTAGLARLETLCARKFAIACYSAGWWLDGNNSTLSGITVDLQRAHAYYRRSCNAGYGAACQDMATAHETGRGEERGTLFVYVWLARACDAAEPVPQGCFLAATMREKIDAPNQAMDVERFYTRACDGGVAMACNNLALMIELRRSTGERSLQRIADLYRRACDGGEQLGCTNLRRADLQLAPPSSPATATAPQAAANSEACDRIDSEASGRLSAVAAEIRQATNDIQRYPAQAQGFILPKLNTRKDLVCGQLLGLHDQAMQNGCSRRYFRTLIFAARNLATPDGQCGWRARNYSTDF